MLRLAAHRQVLGAFDGLRQPSWRGSTPPTAAGICSHFGLRPGPISAHARARERSAYRGLSPPSAVGFLAMSALSKSRAVNVRKDDGKRLEEETRRMEAKLEALRRTMDAAAAESGGSRSARGAEGSRWRSGAASKPIRGYVKGVTEAPRSAANADKDQTRPLPRPPVAGSPSGDVPLDSHGQVRDLVQASGLAMPLEPALSSGRAAGNLQAALAQQGDEFEEVGHFLAGLKLDRYVSIFVENGFDSMDVVQEMQESHMREIGMAPGHILKLQKRLGELRQPVAPAVEMDASPASSAVPGGTQRRVAFGKVEQVNLGAAERSPPGAAVGAEATTKLVAGQFDEAESAASFQEALRAWREGRTAADAPKSSPSRGAAAPPPVGAKQAPGSFWSSLGGSEVDLVRCSTPIKAPTEESSGVDTETQRDPAPSEEKLCCYGCFKQFYKKFAVERSPPEDMPSTPSSSGGSGKRLLCSEACADRWCAAMQEKAQAQRKRKDKLEALREAQRAIEIAESGSVVAAAA